MDKLFALLDGQPVVLGDGAMGTMLQAAGLESGAPEVWNVSRPEVVRDIYQAYVDAGSQVITTNSFGGSRFRLDRHGEAARGAELNRAAAALARGVADAATSETGSTVLVAGSMGPTGEMMAPLGTLTPEMAYAAFAEQAAALADGGADFFLIETMSASGEVEAAIEGARSVSDLPIAATMTFDTGLRTMMGVKPVQALEALYAKGLRVIGANCGNGPDETEKAISEMAAAKPDDVHLIAQSNAGLPKVGPDGKTQFDATPEIMAAYARKMKALGIRYIGGCCGTTPAHIAAMRAVLG